MQPIMLTIKLASVLLGCVATTNSAAVVTHPHTSLRGHGLSRKYGDFRIHCNDIAVMDHPTLSSEGPWFLKAWCLESTTSRSRCTLLNLDDCLANLGEDVSSFSQSCNNCSVDPVRAWEINCKCEPDTSQRAYFDLNAVIANWDGTLGCYDITAPECPENITAEYWRAMPIVSSQ